VTLRLPLDERKRGIGLSESRGEGEDYLSQRSPIGGKNGRLPHLLPDPEKRKQEGTELQEREKKEEKVSLSPSLGGRQVFDQLMQGGGKKKKSNAGPGRGGEGSRQSFPVKPMNKTLVAHAREEEAWRRKEENAKGAPEKEKSGAGCLRISRGPSAILR